MDYTAKIIIVAGIFLVAVGIALSFGSKFFPIGKLPGDILFKKKNFSFYFPFTTSIIISVILSLLFWTFVLLKK